MSLFCSISGTQPLHPVVSSKSGHVYEKDLILKALANNDGKDPITAEQLAEDDLIEVKTGQSLFRFSAPGPAKRSECTVGEPCADET